MTYDTEFWLGGTFVTAVEALPSGECPYCAGIEPPCVLHRGSGGQDADPQVASNAVRCAGETVHGKHEGDGGL